VRNYVRVKVLNWVELQDLQYHAKVIRALIDNPESNDTDN